jgi:hypothetical protein
MTKNIIAASVLLAATLAWAASSYTVNLPKPTMVAGSELRPGDYKLEINGAKAILKHGKTEVEADVTVETGASRYAQTSACCMSEDGKYRLQEIRVGGTNTKLTFKENTGASVGK